jgi:hypothetical protein
MQAITDKMLFTLPDFMASPNNGKTDGPQRPLQSSKSFTKFESPTPDRLTRTQRASTIQNGVASTPADSKAIKDGRMSRTPTDVFEKMVEEEDTPPAPVSEKLPVDFDELPIELVSLTDR